MHRLSYDLHHEYRQACIQFVYVDAHFFLRRRLALLFGTPQSSFPTNLSNLSLPRPSSPISLSLHPFFPTSLSKLWCSWMSHAPDDAPSKCRSQKEIGRRRHHGDPGSQASQFTKNLLFYTPHRGKPRSPLVGRSRIIIAASALQSLRLPQILKNNLQKHRWRASRKWCRYSSHKV